MNFLAQVEKAWSVKSVSWKKEKSQCIKYDTIIYSCTFSSSRSTLSTQVYELISPVDRHLSPPAITRYYHPPSAITSHSHPTFVFVQFYLGFYKQYQHPPPVILSHHHYPPTAIIRHLNQPLAIINHHHLPPAKNFELDLKIIVVIAGVVENNITKWPRPLAGGG